MSGHRLSALRTPLIDGGKTLAQVTEDVCAPIERGPNRSWYYGMAASLTALGIGTVCVVNEIWTGIGT